MSSFENHECWDLEGQRAFSQTRVVEEPRPLPSGHRQRLWGPVTCLTCEPLCGNLGSPHRLAPPRTLTLALRDAPSVPHVECRLQVKPIGRDRHLPSFSLSPSSLCSQSWDIWTHGAFKNTNTQATLQTNSIRISEGGTSASVFFLLQSFQF